MGVSVQPMFPDGGTDAAKIQSFPVSTVDPASGQVLVYNSTTRQWEPSSAMAPLSGGTFSGNVTLNGTANTAPNQTAASGSSLMTRDLVDDRESYWIWCIPSQTNTAKADGAAWIFNPCGYNSASTLIPASIPSAFTRFRVKLNFCFTTNPSADTFKIYVRFRSMLNTGAAAMESSTGTQFAVAGCYPNDTSGIAVTLTDLEAAYSGQANSFAVVSDWVSFPAGWQTNASRCGVYGFVGMVLGNKSGGSLTDNYTGDHGMWGAIEFKK